MSSRISAKSKRGLKNKSQKIYTKVTNVSHKADTKRLNKSCEDFKFGDIKSNEVQIHSSNYKRLTSFLKKTLVLNSVADSKLNHTYNEGVMFTNKLPAPHLKKTNSIGSKSSSQFYSREGIRPPKVTGYPVGKRVGVDMYSHSPATDLRKNRSHTSIKELTHFATGGKSLHPDEGEVDFNLRIKTSFGSFINPLNHNDEFSEEPSLIKIEENKCNEDARISEVLSDKLRAFGGYLTDYKSELHKEQLKSP